MIQYVARWPFYSKSIAMTECLYFTIIIFNFHNHYLGHENGMRAQTFVIST